MKIKHIDHIGIAVKSIEEGGKFFTDILGLKLQKLETVEEQKVKTGFFPITGSELELLESTEPDGPVAKFIEARGEGVRKILSESTAHSGREPFYQLFGEELMLTIWAKPSPHDHNSNLAK